MASPPVGFPLRTKAASSVDDNWNLVVKVKYGDTLRRFYAYVRQGSMDHNMAKLKAKIVGLFEFKHDTQLVLTYIDSDGDEVTLDNDGELHDAAIHQHLNPLRINVKLEPRGDAKPETKLGATNYYSSGLPSAVLQSLQANPSVSEALKCIPQPLQSALLKKSHDFASKAESFSTVCQGFLDYFSKLGLPSAMQSHQVSSGESLGVTPFPANCSNVNDFDNQEDVNKIMQPVEPSALSAEDKKSENVTKTQRVGAKIPVAFHQNLPNSGSSGLPFGDASTSNLKDINLEKKNGSSARLDGEALLNNATVLESLICRPSVSEPKTSEVPLSHVPAINSDIFCPFPHSWEPVVPEMFSTFTAPINSGKKTSAVHNNYPTLPPAILPSGGYPIHPDSSLRTFHAGVQCDGCGMFPIVGPRFNSNVENNFDLCSICFDEMGNENEYTRIGRGHFHYPRITKKLNNISSRVRPPFIHSRQSKLKLESQFVQDVTVLDGTIMPPCTSFTKIWRMRNNGTTVWPCGTQLLWTGGDKLGNQSSVELEISSNGCAMNEEIDVAVNFITPLKPGCYISFWRMAMPSGQKFGQQVWVQIQVESAPPVSTDSFHEDVNLNPIPEDVGHLGHGSGIIDVNVEPVVCVSPSAGPAEVVKPFSSDAHVPIVLPPGDVLLGTNDIVAPVQAAIEASTISYPVVGPAECSSASLVASCPPAGSDINGNPVEEILLKELEEMGFKQINLNKEVLRLNKYDLVQSVCDLCGFAEWEPFLEKLQQMGFNDEELNKKLLLKNAGSIKRVVLDLIAEENAE